MTSGRTDMGTLAAGSADPGAVAALPRPSRRRPVVLAAAILAILIATIAGAFAFQAAGYAPCDLCLKERVPYYIGMALAAVTILAAWRAPRPLVVLCFAGLALLFCFSAALGAYHAGIEWGLWPGPVDCTGPLGHAATNADFLNQLQTIKVVRCDAVAIRILGLSLAGWNAVVSAGLVVVAAAGLLPAGARP